MKFKTYQSYLVEVDMTPMIDIVFQLIAFFMVITNFEQTEADERVKLPRDALARPPEVKLERELVVNVGYLRDDAGRKLDPNPIVFWANENIRVSNMNAKFRQEQRLFQDRKQDPKAVTIVLRVDAEVTTGLVQQLMRMSQDAEFEKFAHKASQSSEAP